MRKLKADLNEEERRQYAIHNPDDDDYKTSNKVLAEIYDTVKWKPVIDICCN